MTLDFAELASLAAVLTALYALYNSIKTTGANKMKNQNEVDTLKKEVQVLKDRLAASEACNTKNDKAIGEMQKDIEWIKEGIKEIKDLLTRKE
jgi:peptidoglycan hydrolase CwlO-like protein